MSADQLHAGPSAVHSKCTATIMHNKICLQIFSAFSVSFQCLIIYTSFPVPWWRDDWSECVARDGGDDIRGGH